MGYDSSAGVVRRSAVSESKEVPVVCTGSGENDIDSDEMGSLALAAG